MHDLLFTKIPCSRPRDIREQDIPPLTEMHSIKDYPLYYSPLWTPQVFIHIFRDIHLLAAWIGSEFSAVPGGVAVEPGIRELVIYSRMCLFPPTVLIFERIASSEFYPGDVMKSQLDFLRAYPPSLSFYNPPWLFQSYEHILGALSVVSLSELKTAVSRFGDVRYRAKTKAECSLILFDNLTSFVRDVASKTDEELRVSCLLIHREVGGPPFSETVISRRSCMLSYILSCTMGEIVAARMRLPGPPTENVREQSEAHIRMLPDMFDGVSESTQLSALKRLSQKILTSCLRTLHPSHRASNVNDEHSSADIILRSFHRRLHDLVSLTSLALRDTFLCLEPMAVLNSSETRIDCVKKILILEYGETVAWTLISLKSRLDSWTKKRLNWQSRSGSADDSDHNLQPSSVEWPKVVDQETIQKCLQSYMKALKWKEPPTCAVCSRSSDRIEYQVIRSDSLERQTLCLELLRVRTPSMIRIVTESGDASVWDIKDLDNLMLHSAGIRRINCDAYELTLCAECRIGLYTGKMPRLALANGLYRGSLPAEFRDLTWIEEMICSKFLTTAIVVRLTLGHDTHKANMLRGNTCAHEMNLVRTAKALPRTPVDVNDMLSVVFLGSKKPEAKDLRWMFFVRRRKVWRFLLWLKDHNDLYSDIVVDQDAMGLYPEDDIMPGVMDRIIVHKTTDAAKIYEEESSSITQHPSELMYMRKDPKRHNEPDAYIEKAGVSDPELVSVHGRKALAAGVRNLICRTTSTSAGLEIDRGSQIVPEYGNAALLPGMYPTLFPYGIGGFDDKKRPTKVSFISQAEYCLDIRDRRFRYHHSFMFVVLNIFQRRTGHLHTSLTVKRAHFEEFAKTIENLSPDIIQKLADVIEHEHSLENLSDEEKKVMNLLKKVGSISSKVPGSAASKTLCRNEIRSYVGIMGVPQIFLTINPSPHHHPVFMLMYGDNSVNLNERYPQLAEPPERARRLTHDPVAAADFFDRCIHILFSHLFGWDFDAGETSSRGGILGHLKGFYGTAEYTERGVLHGHFLIWLAGGMNPSDVHKKMTEDRGFQDRFFEFFEDIIKHELPNVDVTPGFNPATYVPASEMPPNPLVQSEIHHESSSSEIEDWRTQFNTEVKMCAEALQRHTCKEVCHKYGNDDRCRFRFPHEIIEVSHFDVESNSINLRCRDATLNYYNPYIIVYCRHNHDIRCILSGKSAKAAMFYITDYITKMSLKTSEMLSLMCEAVMVAPKVQNASAVDNAKTLLHKCLAQFTRKQQIHAQQAVRYLRKVGDSISSHKTIPIMSNLTVMYNKSRYIGRISAEGSDTDDSEHEDDVGNEGLNRRISEDDDEDCLDDETMGQERKYDNRRKLNDPDMVDQFAEDEGIDVAGAEEVEEMDVEVTVRDDGKIVSTTQFDDYLHRDDRLRNVSFLDFVCCFERDKKTRSKRSDRANSKKRFDLKAPHPLHSSHEIVERFLDVSLESNKIQAIPRVVGMSIPRRSHGDAYHIFVLSHFVPFSAVCDPVPENVTVSAFLKTFKFSEDHKQLMENWEVIYECEDARDADRLAQQERYMLESRELNEALKRKGNDDDEDGVELFAEQSGKKVMKNLWVMDMIRKLRYARYLNPPCEDEPNAPSGIENPNNGINSSQPIRQDELWQKEVDEHVAKIASMRDNILHVNDQSMNLLSSELGGARVVPVEHPSEGQHVGDDGPNDTKLGDRVVKKEKTSKKPARRRLGHAKAIPPDVDSLIQKTPEEAIASIVEKHSLNEKQSAAFVIAAKAWLEVHRRRSLSDQIAPDDISQDVPLRMLMTGPGGTGKSHSIKALKELMELYGSGHRLRLLAPTGSAASLIDGMTCHKGLALKVIKTRGEKRGITRSGLNEKYTLHLNPRRKNEMRQAWRNVDVVLIDEVSLLSLQQLADMDHALRMAKERPDEWFGGIIVIFSGDFCQYPPVGGNPLYTCIRSTKRMNAQELKKRLGRLAWKTLNAVVEFTEQFRMKKDPEYASAVGRLRLRCCTEEDVSLFNSRVIKSVSNPNGPNMALENNRDATMIVPTNDLRERVNQYKAETVCESDSSKQLITCNALDFLGKHVVPQLEHKDLRTHVLDLQTSGRSVEGALPGRIYLFEGMPVILRGRNLAVDLRVANGSQGTIYKIYSDVDEYGFTYASLVLVRFADSPVQLSGLPLGVFPIKPISWSFFSMLEIQPGVFKRCKIRRHQLPIQPGYCVTGHSAQGKTLAKVLCQLSVGLWAAYVATSRARCREDLYLLKEVELKDLNGELPVDLKSEMIRHAALEHNTMIKFGFKTGNLKAVPDAEDRHIRPESDRFVGKSGNLVWDDIKREGAENTENSAANKSTKIDSVSNQEDHIVKMDQKYAGNNHIKTSLQFDQNRHSTLNSGDPTTENPTMSGNNSSEGGTMSKMTIVTHTSTVDARDGRGKKQLRYQREKPNSKKRMSSDCQGEATTNQIRRDNAVQTFQGCVWDSANWSCAYDSFFMILWGAYSSSTAEWRQTFQRYNIYASTASSEFDSLGSPIEPSESSRVHAINSSRDRIRDYISDGSSRDYPRYGPVAVSVQELIQTVLYSHLWSLRLIRRRGYQNHEISIHHRRRQNLWRDLSEVPMLESVGNSVDNVHQHTHQCWITASCTLTHESIWPARHHDECADVDHTPFLVEQPPLLLCLNHTPTMGETVLPVHRLHVPTSSGSMTYQLAGIIYIGSLHFTSRIVINDSFYTYDGQTNNGQCARERRYALSSMSHSDWSSLATLGSRKAHVFIYRKL